MALDWFTLAYLHFQFYWSAYLARGPTILRKGNGGSLNPPVSPRTLSGGIALSASMTESRKSSDCRHRKSGLTARERMQDIDDHRRFEDDESDEN